MSELTQNRKRFEEWARLQGDPFFQVRYYRTSRTTSKPYDWFCPNAWSVWQAATRIPVEPVEVT